MTAPADPDVGEIAAKLTEAQRRMVQSSNTFRERYFSLILIVEIRKLVALGIMEPVAGRDVRSSTFRPSSIGLAVRQHLTERSESCGIMYQTHQGRALAR